MITVRALAQEFGVDVDELLLRIQRTDNGSYSADSPLEPELVRLIRKQLGENVGATEIVTIDRHTAEPDTVPDSSNQSISGTEPSVHRNRDEQHQDNPRNTFDASPTDAERGGGIAGPNAVDKPRRYEDVSTLTEEERGQFALAIGFTGSGKSSLLDIAARSVDLASPFDLQGTPVEKKTVFSVHGGRNALLDISGESFQRYLFRRTKANFATYQAIAASFNAAVDNQKEMTDKVFDGIGRMIRDATTLIVVAKGWRDNRGKQAVRIANDLASHLDVSKSKRVVVVLTQCDLLEEELSAIYSAGSVDLRKPNLSSCPTSMEVEQAFRAFGGEKVDSFNVLQAIAGFANWHYAELLYPPSRYIERYAAEQLSRTHAADQPTLQRWSELASIVRGIKYTPEYDVRDTKFVDLVRNGLFSKVFRSPWRRYAPLAAIGSVMLLSALYVFNNKPTVTLRETANLNNYSVQTLSFYAGKWQPNPYINLTEEAMQAMLRKLMFGYERSKPALRSTKIIDYRPGTTNPPAQALAASSHACSQMGLVNRYSTEVVTAISSAYQNTGFPLLISNAQIASATSGKLVAGKEIESCRSILAGLLRLRWEIAQPGSDVKKLAPLLTEAFSNIRSIDQRLLMWYGLDDNVSREEPLIARLTMTQATNSPTQFRLVEPVAVPLAEPCARIYSDGLVWLPSSSAESLACESELTELGWIKADAAGGTGSKSTVTPSGVVGAWSAVDLQEFCRVSGTDLCKQPGAAQTSFWWGAIALLVLSTLSLVASMVLRKDILRRQLSALWDELRASFRERVRGA